MSANIFLGLFWCVSSQYPFNDETLAPKVRAMDLINRLTISEKVGMLFMDANMAFGNDTLPVNGDLPTTSVPRLNVPQFNWMSGGNHYRGAPNGCVLNCCTACLSGGGCCHDGFATQLPQGTGVAATFNVELAFALGNLSGQESRGIQNTCTPRLTDYRTGASSVINIARDGRWGRIAETYGECPFLTAEISVAFNQGLMGFASPDSPPPEYFQVTPIIRHFVAYAGPDSGRFTFDALVSEDDLRLTFLPAWRRLVAAGALGGVMSAISSLNSIPSAAHTSLLSGVLRGEWNASAFVISDCSTIAAIAEAFHYTATVEQAAVSALRAGGDLDCGPDYALLLNASADGWLQEEELTAPLLRLMTARVRSGALNINQTDPWSTVPYSVVDSPSSRALARRSVQEAVVLLSKGDGCALPLGLGSACNSSVGLLPPPPLKNLLVVGPSADDPSVQAHTYHGTPWRWTTVLTGIREALNSTVNVTYVQGCSRAGSSTSGFAPALALASDWADAVVFVGGLEASMEEEDTDRGDFTLPGQQMTLVQALAAASSTQNRGVPLVVLVISGGPVSEPWLVSPAAVAARVGWLWVSYFGQDGGGVADVLLGSYSPSGRLPFTMPWDTTQVGPISDYSMRGLPYGRTYRYLAVSSDGFTELDGTELTGTLIVGGPGCDDASVPGQCCFPRDTAKAACLAWQNCTGLVCNPSRNDCQARGSPLVQTPGPFTSFVKDAGNGTGATPLFPFAFGLSFASISTVALFQEGGTSATLGATVSVTATLLHAAGPDTDFTVCIFGEFLTCAGGASPVPALPRRTMLAFKKVFGVQRGSNNVTISFTLDSLHVPGVDRHPFPGLLRIWAGNGGACLGCPEVTVELIRGEEGCGTDSKSLRDL